MAGEEIEMHDYTVNDDGFDDEETPLLDNRESLRNELLKSENLKTKVGFFYESIGQEPPDVIVNNDFEIQDEHLYLKKDNGELVRLTTKADPYKFLAKSTVRSKLSVREQRRFDIKELKPEDVSKLQNMERELPTDSQLQSIPLRGLIQSADKIITETSFIEDDEQTALKTLHDEPLPMREIMALNASLRSIRGELTNNLAKLGELDRKIEREKEKLVQADDDNLDTDIKEEIQQRLRGFENERSARLEALSANREQLRTQVSRIRETINRILHEDTTLAERIKTLFREQGITIASILTAFGFVISTIVLAITGTGSSSPPPPSSNSDLKGWMKKQLKHLSELLKKLAIKAADSLPAIIGTIVSWIFSTVGTVVGYMADHLWTLLILASGILISKIKKY